MVRDLKTSKLAIQRSNMGEVGPWAKGTAPTRVQTLVNELAVVSKIEWYKEIGRNIEAEQQEPYKAL